jgi:hypothetical protein
VLAVLSGMVDRSRIRYASPLRRLDRLK